MNDRFDLFPLSGNDVRDFINDGACGYKGRIQENMKLRWFFDDPEMLKVNSFYKCKELDVTIW